MDYFDNNEVEQLVAEYQLYNPQSLEARLLSNAIMIEANKVISRVIMKYSLHRFSTYDETFSYAQEKVLMCLKNFNPVYGSLFNYLTSTIRKGCKNQNIINYQKKQNSVKTCQLHINMSSEEYQTFQGTEIWNEYKNAFNERPYLLPVFKEMCSIIDDDPTHSSEWYLIGTLTSRKNLFTNAHGNQIKNRREMWKYLGWIKEVIGNEC